jgi:hypothetical protein
VIKEGDRVQVHLDLRRGYVTFKLNGSLVACVGLPQMALIRREHRLLAESEQEMRTLDVSISSLQQEMYEQGALRHRKRVEELKRYKDKLQIDCSTRRLGIRSLAEDFASQEGCVRLWPALLFSNPGDSVKVCIQGDSTRLFATPLNGPAADFLFERRTQLCC